MITKITKLKNFGIFQDFSWKTNLQGFSKFNLIYGWNRTGKTTLSRVFASCEKKCAYDEDQFRQYPENGEFEIKTKDNTTVKNNDIATNILPIKVFNQDFIDDNISFDTANSTRPIVYVSEEDIESKKRLEKLKTDKVNLEEKYQDAMKDYLAKKEVKSVFLKGLGITIANIVFDKTYNKTDAENKINEIGIDNFADKALTDDDRKKYEEISKSPAGKELPVFSSFELKFLFNDEQILGFEGIFSIVKSLLDKKVVSETLERLKDDQTLNAWVKQGFDLHKSKDAYTKCLFCQNSINTGFFDILSKHFSKDYIELQETISFLVTEINKIQLTKMFIQNNELYPDLQENYNSNVNDFNKIIEKVNIWKQLVIELLEKKSENPFDSDLSEMISKPDDFIYALNSIIEDLNLIITSHNEKIKNHSQEVNTAREKLELHSIAQALEAQDYKKFEEDLSQAAGEEIQTKEKVNENTKNITTLEQKTSNIGRAVQKINIHLKEFFGREEIKLELDGDKKGYIIKREGHPAKNLSEGEKTAIAFSYFIVKVEEKEFKVKEAIIFIDDPISSFDSNFIYHTFSLIKNHFNEVGQLFISTHNFQFFNLVKDWFIKKNRNIEENNKERKLLGKEEKLTPCEFYMIKCDLNEGKRKAKIIELDNTLKKNKSEYTFLFGLLKDFDAKTEEATFEEIYNIANIGRRFFDIYADFKVPTNSCEQKEKIDILVKEINKLKLDEDKISKATCDKLFWLINGFSHNSDPTSAIEHKDKSESKEAIRILLNIVKESDPKHYEILEKNLI